MDGSWPLLHVSLDVRRRQPINQLPGFRASHRLPTDTSARSQTFVSSLTQPQLKRDLDQVFDRIRRQFRFRRTEINCHEEPGAGTITTPSFQYDSTFALCADDHSQVEWHQSVSQMAQAEAIISTPFEGVFGELFDCVTFYPSRAIDLEALIDRFEATDDARLDLDYDREITRCELRIAGSRASVQVEPERLQIVHPYPAAPRELVRSLIEVQSVLVDFSSLQLTDRPSGHTT